MTFAGSPDRVEARLVPERGYEFDAFRITGLPRRPGLAQARAALHCARRAGRLRPDPRAAAARRRARRRRLRRGADGARRVAAPDPGRADRGRRASRPREPARGAVRASASSSPSRSPAAGRRSTASSAGRMPAPPAPVPRAEARRAARPARGGAGAARLRRLARRARAQRAGGRDASARRGRRCCTSPGERDYDELRGRVTRPDYVLVPLLDELGAAYGAADLALACGRLDGLGARGGRPAGGARPVPVRDRRPPGEERALVRRRPAARSSCPRPSSDGCPELVRSLLDDPRRLAAMGAAMRRVARPDAAEGIAEELIALARR